MSSSKNHFNLLCFLLFLSGFLSGGKLLAQVNHSPEYLYVESYGLEEGLRQSMVSSIIQDTTGLIWLTSGDGLHSFDGKGFRAYRIAYNGTYYHSDNMMRKISMTSSSDFLISSSSSLIGFNPLTAGFTFINRELSVYTVLLDAFAGHLSWKFDKGFCLVKNDSLIPLKILWEDNRRPPADMVPDAAVMLGSKSAVIMSNKGILTMSANAEKNSYSCNWIDLPGCTGISKDRKGNIFILCGTSIFAYESPNSISLYKNINIRPGIVFLSENNGVFWFTDETNRKLYKLDNKGLRQVVLLELSGKNTDTINSDIKELYRDKAGKLWIGTDGYGLLKLDPERIFFNKLLIGFTRCITSSDKKLYVGTYNNGLWKCDEDLSNAVRLNPALFDDEEYITSITTDRLSRLWVVTRKGVYAVDTDGNLLFSHKGNCISGRVIKNSSDTLLIMLDNNLLKFSSGEKPRLISERKFYQLTTMLTHMGKTWTGTPSALYFSGNTGNPDFSRDKQLLNTEIFDLAVIDNEVWAATGNGVQAFSHKGNLVGGYPALNKLKNEAVYSLVRDSYNRIWFSGIRGMGYITPDKKSVVRFWPENNLQSLEFNQNAFCKTETGYICFGGINGINSIDPSLLNKQVESPELRIFTLFVSDTIYNKGILPLNIRINPDRLEPNVSGKVFVTDYGQTSHTYFSFYLKNFENAWTEPSEEPYFSYRNLPPGTYRLYVKYTDHNNITHPAQFLLTIHIKPAFWQTWWFTIAAIILGFISTVLIVRKVQDIRYRNRIKALEQEKAIEKERIRISKDMHDEVGASLTRISILSELVRKQQGIPANSSELIDKISNIAGDVVDELSEIIWAMNPKNDNLETFAAYIRNYAGNYLDSTGINIKFDYPVEILPIQMSAELRRNLFLILKEALHNVVKHSGASHVLVRLLPDRHKLTLTVKDDGKGIREDARDGNGLHNMRRRAEESGGVLTIDSSPDYGTSVSVVVALTAYTKSH